MKYPTWLSNAIATGRVVIGVIYLWAGLEKVIGAGGTWTAKGFLAYATGGSLAWPFVSGEPVEGTIYNPTHDFWVSLSANTTPMPSAAKALSSAESSTSATTRGATWWRAKYALSARRRVEPSSGNNIGAPSRLPGKPRRSPRASAGAASAVTADSPSKIGRAHV